MTVKKRVITCPACRIEIEAKAEFIEKPDRCKGPGGAAPCPVDLIWETIKQEQARQAARGSQREWGQING